MASRHLAVLVALLLLLPSCARDRATVAQQAVVIVGAVEPSGRVRTHGSGFVVRRANQHYVVTSRHLIAQGARKLARSWFAIPRPRKTMKLADGERLVLGDPVFHSGDSEDRTYDVAVLPVLAEHSHAQPILLRDIALDLDRSAPTKFAEGEAVTAIGYPVAYADAELSRDVTEPLVPLECRGTISHDSRALNSSQSGFTAPLVDFHFAATSEPCLGYGASGGPIVAGAHATPRLVGMLVGNRNLPPTGFVFTDLRFILETVPTVPTVPTAPLR